MGILELNLVVIIHGNIHEVVAFQPIRSALLWLVWDVTPHLLSGAILHVYFPLSYLVSDEEKRELICLVFLPELMCQFTSSLMVD